MSPHMDLFYKLIEYELYLICHYCYRFQTMLESLSFNIIRNDAFTIGLSFSFYDAFV